MKRASLLFLFVCIRISSFGQYQVTPEIRSMYPDTFYAAKISFSVIDIITRKPVTGCTLTLKDTSDRPIFSMRLDSVFDTTIVFRNLCGYYVTITKPGYDTLVADWWSLSDNKEYFVDFYLRKEHLTKEEKKTAAQKSKGIPSHHPEQTDQGGFQKIEPRKEEIVEWKVEEYGEWSSGSSRSLRKIKYLN